MSKRKHEPVGTAVLLAVSAVVVACDLTARALTWLLGHREHPDAEPWQPGDHEFCDLTDEELDTLAATEVQLATISSEDVEGAR